MERKRPPGQTALPFGAAEGTHAERQAMIKIAIQVAIDQQVGITSTTLHFREFILYVAAVQFVGGKTGGTLKKTYAELGEHFVCSPKTIRNVVDRATETGIVTKQRVVYRTGGRRENEYAIDLQRVRAIALNRSLEPAHGAGGMLSPESQAQQPRPDVQDAEQIPSVYRPDTATGAAEIRDSEIQPTARTGQGSAQSGQGSAQSGQGSAQSGRSLNKELPLLQSPLNSTATAPGAAAVVEYLRNEGVTFVDKCIDKAESRGDDTAEILREYGNRRATWEDPGRALAMRMIYGNWPKAERADPARNEQLKTATQGYKRMLRRWSDGGRQGPIDDVTRAYWKVCQQRGIPLEIAAQGADYRLEEFRMIIKEE